VAGFEIVDAELRADGARLVEIARAVGTPLHVYSAPLIAERFSALERAFAAQPHTCHYAIKANATLAIVRLLRSLGAQADANSGGEIDVALRAGFAPREIVFTGVGKSRAELERAVALDLKAINAESPGEVERIEAIAGALGRCARVAIRVNPDVDAGTHPHISTGHQATKFGMSVEAAHAMAETVRRRPHLQIVGLHAHIGSQLVDPHPIARMAETVVALARELVARGIALEHLDLGGGLGIPYEPHQRVLSVADYAAAILPTVRSTGLRLILEPGRWIVGPAGVILTEVVDMKPQPHGRWFVIVDAGMTDLIRPALYGAWHAIEPVLARGGAPIRADVVGPVCETADTFATDRELPPIEVGDVLAIRDTGAYGSVMASNYNRRPMAAEVVVDGPTWRVVRRRQSIDDLLQWDE
jgi:diaminopimelate decarboxylase